MSRKEDGLERSITAERVSIEIQNVGRQFAFCKNVGVTGICLFCISLLLGTCQLLIAMQYTLYFQISRDGVWLFVAFSILFLLLVVYHLIFWKHMAEEAIKNATMGKKEKKKKEKKRKKFKLQKYIENFGFNGKWFLVKVYASEIIESCVQGYNLWNLYSCVLSPTSLLILCTFLFFDHVYRLYMLWQPYNAVRRDTQVFVDLCVDIICSSLPLLSLWAFEIPFSVREITFLLLWPLGSTFLKLYDLMEENVSRRSTLNLIVLAESISVKNLRNRQSLFSKTAVEIGLEQQLSYFGRKVKLTISLFTIIMGFGFIIFGFLVFSVRLNCGKFWSEACTIKLPFCRLDFACDCAILDVDKHNFTMLPDAVHEMKNLRSVSVTRGPLRHLPSLENFGVLARLNMNENLLNQLSDLPQNILYLSFEKNNVSSIQFLGKLNHLVTISASYNNISTFPPVGASLTQMLMRGNNLKTIGDTKEIRILDVGENRIESLPAQSGVVILEIHNNNLTALPSWSHLSVLDARYNLLQNLPEDVHLTDAWLRGNPLCENGWEPSSRTLKNAFEKPGRGCTKQCSNVCLDVDLGDGYCNSHCNSKPCNFDKGDCDSTT